MGKGGEGRVYLVRHLVTERLRAAKVLQDGLNGNCFHELNMLKHLYHPSLPQILDVQEDEDGVWLIMEYIRGTSLEETLQHDLKAEQLFYILKQLLEVLNYLHTRSVPVLHLDIKPSNILITPDGKIKLIDFGTSVEYLEGQHKQHHFGTKGFAAPEQKIPDGTADVRTDIYGFGAVLYYCLFLRIPDDFTNGRRGWKQRKQKKKERWKKDSENKKPTYSKTGGCLWRRTLKRIAIRCMKEKKEERFQDSRQLYRCVKRAENYYHLRKYVLKTSCSLLLLGATVFFSVKTMMAEYESGKKKEQQYYIELLEQSEHVGLEQAYLYLKDAADLYPQDDRWAKQFLVRITEDYLMEQKEEKLWNQLLFETISGDGVTRKEVLEEGCETYCDLACQVGMTYWYYYEGSGGKYAAKKWFEEAIQCAASLETGPDWLESARVHAKIGGYYENMGRIGSDRKQEITVQIYWDDLICLWNMKLPHMSSWKIRYQTAEELLSCIIMQGYELIQNGTQRNTMQSCIDQIREYVSETDEPEQKEGLSERSIVLKRCIEAEQSLKRIPEEEDQ